MKQSLAPVPFLLLGLLLAPPPASAQVIAHPNQIFGVLELTNSNPEILSYLNGPADTPPGRDLGRHRVANRPRRRHIEVLRPLPLQDVQVSLEGPADMTHPRWTICWRERE